MAAAELPFRRAQLNSNNKLITQVVVYSAYVTGDVWDMTVNTQEEEIKDDALH